MPSRDDVYIEARRWVGTPYHHEGHHLGQSCDCIGLIIGVGRALGFTCPTDQQVPQYSPNPHDHLAERGATEWLSPARDPVLIGQIGLFWVSERGHGQHFCIYAQHGGDGRMTMIHSYMRIGRVIETGISDFWRKRLIRVYDFKEMANA